MRWAIAGTGLVLGLFTVTGAMTRSPNVALAKPAYEAPSVLTQAADPGSIVTLASGLQYVDLEVGQGAIAQSSQIAVVHYIGALEDGTVFDSSWSRNWPFAFPLGGGRVIQGWDEGVQGMKVGGTRRLIVPADLAYGDEERGPIPANSTLIFEIELLGVRNPEG